MRPSDIDKEIGEEVQEERERIEAKWGVQEYEMGTNTEHYAKGAVVMRELCERHAAEKRVTWVDVLNEEMWEFFAEETWERQRAELIQVAAVAMNAIACGDRAEADRAARGR